MCYLLMIVYGGSTMQLLEWLEDILQTARLVCECDCVHAKFDHLEQSE